MGDAVERPCEASELPEQALLRPWQVRAARAEAVMDAFNEFFTAGDVGEAEAQHWLAGLDRRSHVGSRHHFVPRFMLDRWATSGQVLVYSRIEARYGIRNVRDLAIKDFYTFIDLNGEKDSSMESILGVVEQSAAAVLDDLLNPFAFPRPVEVWEVAALAQLAAYQTVRTPRHRREIELHAEWFAKTVAQGRIPDARLREITVTPHQNDAIRMMRRGRADNDRPLRVSTSSTSDPGSTSAARRRRPSPD